MRSIAPCHVLPSCSAPTADPDRVQACSGGGRRQSGRQTRGAILRLHMGGMGAAWLEKDACGLENAASPTPSPSRSPTPSPSHQEKVHARRVLQQEGVVGLFHPYAAPPL